MSRVTPPFSLRSLPEHVGEVMPALLRDMPPLAIFSHNRFAPHTSHYTKSSPLIRLPWGVNRAQTYVPKFCVSDTVAQGVDRAQNKSVAVAGDSPQRGR